MKNFLVILCLISITGDIVTAVDIPIKGICRNHDECVSDFSFCNDEDPKVCQCNPGYVPQLDLMECLEIHDGIGAPCSESPQCEEGQLGEYSECKNNECVCKAEAAFLVEAGRCLPVPDKIGGTCIITAQCTFHLGPEARCDRGTCLCNAATSIPNGAGDKCLNLINDFTTPCEESVQCVHGSPGEFSECSTTCQCTGTTVAVPGINKCLAPVGMSEECYHDIQCSTPELGGLGTCVKDVGAPTGVCGCATTGIPIGIRCLPKVNELGGPCEDAQQCKQGLPGQHSTCAGNKCACNSNAVPGPELPKADNVCYLKASNLGDQCQVHSQCTSVFGDGSECWNSRFCSCKTGFVQSEDGQRCLAKSLIGESCEQLSQCPMNAVCHRFETCECQIDFVPDGSKANCLAVVNYLDDPCEEPQQCQEGRPGSHSDCLSSACKCQANAFNLPERHVCHIKATKLDDPCVTDPHCDSLPNAKCIEYSCQCPPGFKPNPGEDGCESEFQRYHFRRG